MIFNTANTTSAAGADQEKYLPSNSIENRICDSILDVCFDVHRKYGPGLLESAYEKIIAHDLIHKNNMRVELQKTLPIIHDGIIIELGYRLDMVVEGKVIIELKAVEKMSSIYVAQLMTYLRLSSMRLGLLVNFNEKLLKNGIKRIVN